MLMPATLLVNVNMTLKNAYITDNIAKKYEKALLDNAKELYIKNITTTIGLYVDIADNEEEIENAFILSIELEEFREENFVENYINPILNFSFDFEDDCFYH